jgi:hypothetical protein
MDVGVTDAAEENIDLDIRWTGFAAVDGERSNRRRSRLDPIGIWLVDEWASAREALGHTDSIFSRVAATDKNT